MRKDGSDFGYAWINSSINLKEGRHIFSLRQSATLWLKTNWKKIRTFLYQGVGFVSSD